MLQRISGTASAKPYRGLAMEGAIARWYARTTQMDQAEFRLLAERIRQSVPAGSPVLEVAPGPGYLAIELARQDLAVEAVDISDSFLRIANDNARAAGVDATFRAGDAHALPFANESFAFVVCRAAFKNFSRPVTALHEMARVLRPAAQALVIDMRRDASDAEIARFAAGRSTSQLGAWWNGWIMKTMVRRQAYLVEEFQRMAAEAGFAHCEIQRQALGFEAWLQR